jgi:hypothetical protein
MHSRELANLRREEEIINPSRLAAIRPHRRHGGKLFDARSFIRLRRVSLLQGFAEYQSDYTSESPETTAGFGSSRAISKGIGKVLVATSQDQGFAHRNQTSYSMGFFPTLRTQNERLAGTSLPPLLADILNSHIQTNSNLCARGGPIPLKPQGFLTARPLPSNYRMNRNIQQ